MTRDTVGLNLLQKLSGVLAPADVPHCRGEGRAEKRRSRQWTNKKKTKLKTGERVLVAMAKSEKARKLIGSILDERRQKLVETTLSVKAS